MPSGNHKRANNLQHEVPTPWPDGTPQHTSAHTDRPNIALCAQESGGVRGASAQALQALSCKPPEKLPHLFAPRAKGALDEAIQARHGDKHGARARPGQAHACRLAVGNGQTPQEAAGLRDTTQARASRRASCLSTPPWPRGTLSRPTLRPRAIGDRHGEHTQKRSTPSKHEHGAPPPRRNPQGSAQLDTDFHLPISNSVL